MDVLGRAAGQLLGLRAVEAQRLRELIRDALKGFRRRGQARLHRVARGLDASVEHVSASARGLLANLRGLVRDGASRAGGSSAASRPAPAALSLVSLRVAMSILFGLRNEYVAGLT